MRQLRTALAVFLVTAISALGVVGIASPAFAATDQYFLQNEFQNSAGLQTVVSLEADIDASSVVIYVSRSVTLDLNGHALSVLSLQLTSGATLLVQDSGTTGSLTADSSADDFLPAIETTYGTLLLTDGDVVATGSTFGAAIGGGYGRDAGTVTISGGTVDVTAGDFGAGLGGGEGGGAGVLSVTGGTLTAEGGRGAAIGSGDYASGATGTITISGGSVTATVRPGTLGSPIGGGSYAVSGPISITGGVVVADASGSVGAAAIGGGGTDSGLTAGAPSVTITGGTVTATAGTDGTGIGGGRDGFAGAVSIGGTAKVWAYGSLRGAAIGGGLAAGAGTVSISGSATVIAAAIGLSDDGTAAAIGGGHLSAAVDVTISGGTVVASTDDPAVANAGAAIGSGLASAPSNVTISGGDVTASGGSSGAGIGGGSNSDSGTILISGGTVTASAGTYGASIGGGLHGSATSTTISGGTVTALGSLHGAAIGGGDGSFIAGTGNGGTITISGGIVEAHQQYLGAGIGGGNGGAGGNVSIGAGAQVTAIADTTYSADPSYPALSIIGPGAGSTTFGTLSVAGSLIVGSDSYLEVPSTSVTTIESTGVISGPGAVRGFGVATIVNHGIISNQSVTVPAVTDHHYVVTFEPNSADTTSPTGATAVHVYAPTMGSGLRSTPDYTRDNDFLQLAGWSTSTDGRADFIATTVLTEDLSVYGVWGPPHLELTPFYGVVEAGESLTFTASGYGFDQNDGGRVELGDFSDRATFTTNDPTATVDGNVVTFGHAGVVSVTATLGSAVIGGAIIVQPGPLTSLVITFDDPGLDHTTIVAGSTVSFSIDGFDVNGTFRSDYTNSADIESTNLTDVLYGGAVYFTEAGTRTITLESDGVSTEFDVTVVPATLESIVPEFSGYSIAAGVPVSIVVTGSDHYGNTLGEVSDRLSYVSSNGETFTGNSVTFDEVGDWIVTVSDPSDANVQQVQVTINVVAAGLDHFEVSGSATTATAGENVYVTVQGYDEFDNYVGNYNDQAVLTSDLAADIEGMRAQVTEAGVHTITATLGSATGSFTVTVGVGAIYRLGITSVDSGAVTAGGTRTFSAHTVDEFGNVIADVTAATAFGSYDLPDYNLDGVSGQTITFLSAGSHVVVAEWDDNGTTVYGNLSVSVVPAAIDYLEISPGTNVARSGTSTTYVVTAFDVFDNPVTLAAGDAVLSSSLDAQSISGLAIVFGEAGTGSVTATVGDVSVDAAITVVFGTLASVDVTVAAGTHVAGDTADFTTVGYDAYGNSADYTALVSYSRGGVTGNNVVVTAAGDHSVTATYGTFQDSESFTVVPAAADHLVVSPSTSGVVVAGGSRSYTAAAYDEFDNLVGDVTGDTSFWSTNSDDTNTSPSFVFEEAGTRAIQAEWNTDTSVTGELAVVVTADAQHPESLLITPSSVTPDQDGTITITVSGFDEFGNPLTGLEDAVTITSDQPSDIINGNRITFPHASPHVITVTLGTASTSILIEVTPRAVAAAALAATGTDPALVLLLAAMLLIFGIAVIFRRRLA